MQDKATLNPTPDQTFEIVGQGAYDFVRVLTHSKQLQRQGRVEEACNERFHAFQRISELLPEDEEVILEWEDPNTRAALEVIHASAIDHFLINDFEMSTAMLELLLELDPEDHLEAIILLAFNYLAMEEYELFDEVSNDISDKYACKEVLTMWAAFRRSGRIPEGDAIRFRTRFAPYFAGIYRRRTSCRRAVPGWISSERPSVQAQARELWLRTENLWTLFPILLRRFEGSPSGLLRGSEVAGKRAYKARLSREGMRGERLCEGFPRFCMNPTGVVRHSFVRCVRAFRIFFCKRSNRSAARIADEYRFGN
ncbi:MAG: hypothetical protein ACLVJK_01755 [Alistipes putredinis]